MAKNVATVSLEMPIKVTPISWGIHAVYIEGVVCGLLRYDRDERMWYSAPMFDMWETPKSGHIDPSWIEASRQYCREWYDPMDGEWAKKKNDVIKLIQRNIQYYLSNKLSA